MRKLIFFIIIFIAYSGHANWEKIGQDIDGEAEEDNSGGSISLSADGTIVAIGAKGNSANGSNTGHVRIYTFDNGSWIQLGQDIDGVALGDYFGGSVSLSADGSVVAIGATQNDDNGDSAGHVRVFTLINGVWVQTGQDINGEASGDYSGSSVSLSVDGTVVAIGAYANDGNGSNSGHVRVYYFSNGVWLKMGQDIDGEAEYDYSGEAVSLSADGTVVAIGAPENDGNGDSAGHVRIFAFENDSWIQMGQDIDGEAEYDYSGRSVSLSADGTVVAIGAPENDGNGDLSGHVRVFTLINDVWVQTGQDIDSEDEGDYSGHAECVSLSADGTVVAIGADQNNGNGGSSGHVRIYTLDDGSWVQISQDIDGEAAGDYSGAVSLIADGTVVAVGSSLNNGNGNRSGHVRIYALNALSTDPDGDNLSNFKELHLYGTDTNNVDTDGDGWSDYFEVNFEFSPTSSDSILASNSLASSMMTTNEAYSMFDAAYENDLVISVSNNTADIVMTIEQSTNLTIDSWTTNKFVTNSVPVDANTKFFRFKLAD